MNQNENKRLTADETLKKWCEYTYPSLPDAAKMALQTACLSYAAQQVKGVTEERDEAIRLLGETLSVMDPDPGTATGRKGCAIVRLVRDFYYSHRNATKEGEE